METKSLNMVNITHKTNTLRKAIATATVTVSDAGTIRAIEEKKIPKGDVFEFSRAAGLLAIKKTSDVIPDCHPLPVEFAAITHSIEGLNITIAVEVHTIYKTGVEVEAMHGAAITALTMYDMLKPVDKNVEVSSIRLKSKTGGKSDVTERTENIRCAVVVCSDAVSKGSAADRSGRAIAEKIARFNLHAEVTVVPDELEKIQQTVKQMQASGVRLLLLTGGTGLSPRDVTPEAIRPLLEREVPGIMEAARGYGQQRTPYAMLSRGVAGFIEEMLVLTLPGSERAVVETIDAVFPQVLHVFDVAEGIRHERVP